MLSIRLKNPIPFPLGPTLTLLIAHCPCQPCVLFAGALKFLRIASREAISASQDVASSIRHILQLAELSLSSSPSLPPSSSSSSSPRPLSHPSSSPSTDPTLLQQQQLSQSRSSPAASLATAQHELQVSVERSLSALLGAPMRQWQQGGSFADVMAAAVGGLGVATLAPAVGAASAVAETLQGLKMRCVT